MKKTLGGDRLRSENKMTVDLHGYGRSSHNVGKIIRTSQAAGTLVPYWCQLATDGTTFYVDITTRIKTIPTVGPIFGSFKHQIDIFCIPIRLYIAALHNNALGIGLRMQSVYLPQMTLPMLSSNNEKWTNPEDPNISQIDPSSILSYIGIRGTGMFEGPNIKSRDFNAVYLLAYWDIFKNYYSNKQEETAYVIGSKDKEWVKIELVSANGASQKIWNVNQSQQFIAGDDMVAAGLYLVIEFEEEIYAEKAKEVTFMLGNVGKIPGTDPVKMKLGNGTMFTQVPVDLPALPELVDNSKPSKVFKFKVNTRATFAYTNSQSRGLVTAPNRKSIQLVEFELALLDDMRNDILAANQAAPFNITKSTSPYTEALQEKQTIGNNGYPYTVPGAWWSQAGLAVKTYLSDRFNNWLNSNTIEAGGNGINEITAVDVSDGKLTMDALILSKKLFNLMNRIAISDGSYSAWREASYGIRTITTPESPIYCGGIQSEITFSEIVSNAATENEPLGTLAGKGNDTMHKSGRGIKIKCDEPSIIMAIGSITPRVDYSQGNKWYSTLKTMADLHQPELDALGFQELVTDEFAAFDTHYEPDVNKIVTNSVGKQPSWIEYMTDQNETFGDFAAGMPLSFMAVNRNYRIDSNGHVEDATTYIDPSMYNVLFADADLSAQNFWVQVAFDVTARRVMSAKQIPNL